jgi:K+-sensing histidine kinase KdpD
VTQAKPRTLARFGSMLLGRPPLSAPLGFAVAVACIAAETAVLLLLKRFAPDNSFGVLYLIGVLVVATGWSAGLAAATAVASAVAYDYLRRWPDVSGVLNRVEDWVVIFVFVVVGLVAHVLARIARARAADAGVLAEQQAALRRVATLVARGVPASEVFPAVAHELAISLGVANASLWRYEPDGTATLVAARDDPGQTADARRQPVEPGRRKHRRHGGRFRSTRSDG